VLVKAKALHHDAFFQMITGRVISMHFILSQQKGDRMGSNLEEEEATPSPAYHALTTSTCQQRSALKQFSSFERL
jgi:hypothetical protein